MVTRVRCTPLQHHRILCNAIAAGAVKWGDPYADVNGADSTVDAEFQKFVGALNAGELFEDAGHATVLLDLTLMKSHGKVPLHMSPGVVYAVAIGEAGTFSATVTSGSFGLFGSVDAAFVTDSPLTVYGSGVLPRRIPAAEGQFGNLWLAPGMPAVDVLFDLLA